MPAKRFLFQYNQHGKSLIFITFDLVQIFFVGDEINPQSADATDEIDDLDTIELLLRCLRGFQWTTCNLTRLCINGSKNVQKKMVCSGDFRDRFRTIILLIYSKTQLLITFTSGYVLFITRKKNCANFICSLTPHSFQTKLSLFFFYDKNSTSTSRLTPYQNECQSVPIGTGRGQISLSLMHSRMHH